MTYSGVTDNHLLFSASINGYRIRNSRMVERKWAAGDTMVARDLR